MRLRSWPLFVLPFLVACGGAEEPLGTAEEPIKVCPGPSTIAGLDVSHWQGAINWGQVKASGKVFAFIRATEGTTFVDPMFASNWAAAKQQGVVRSAGHFFHPNLDPIAEANHFLQIMGPLAPGDLPPMLDLEVDDGQSAATITSAAIQWLDYVAQQTGIKPIVLTTPSFVTTKMGSPPGFQTHALLWIANWGVQCPDVPAPFTSWKFWQSSDMGAVTGISGAVDVDVFNGTLAQLTGITVQTPGSSSSAAASSSSSSGMGGAGGMGGVGGVGGAGGLIGTPEVTSAGPGVGSGIPAGSGEGGGDNGLTPGNPGCTCSMPGHDDETSWVGGVGFFALAIGLGLRGRLSRRHATS